MANNSDILVIGGGIAGLSAAAELSKNARVTVLEAEEQIGFHSSGRSATMVHYALGDRLVRELTLASRSFFDSPPGGFSDVPLGHRMSVLVHGREDEREQLDALYEELSIFAELERLNEEGVHRLCPLLKAEARHGIADRNGTRLDPHALLQGNLRMLRRNGGRLETGSRVSSIKRHGDAWSATTEGGDTYSAAIIVNAAGSWADQLARFAGVAPLGLEPKRRRSSPSMRRQVPTLTVFHLRRRSVTNSISPPRAAGCSHRPWTRSRASPAMPSRMNMKSPWLPTEWRSGLP